jgi:acyl carrier protein
LLGGETVRACVMPVDWPKFLSGIPSGGIRRYFAELEAISEVPSAGRGSPGDTDLPARLARARAAERRTLLDTHVREQVVKVLGLGASFALDPHRGLGDLGIDSLMSLELKNRLQAGVGRPLPATLAFDYPTITGLVDFLARELSDEEPERAAEVRPGGMSERELEALDALSPEEAEALLLEELFQIGGTVR